MAIIMLVILVVMQTSISVSDISSNAKTSISNGNNNVSDTSNNAKTPSSNGKSNREIVSSQNLPE